MALSNHTGEGLVLAN